MKLGEYKKKYGTSKKQLRNLTILLYHSEFESLVIQRKCFGWEYDRFIFFGDNAYDVVHLQIGEKDLLRIIKNTKYDEATVRIQPININLGNKIRRMVGLNGR